MAGVGFAVGAGLSALGGFLESRQARRQARELRDLERQRQALFEQTAEPALAQLQTQAQGILSPEEERALGLSQRRAELGVQADIEAQRRRLIERLARVGGLSATTSERFLSPAGSAALAALGRGEQAARTEIRTGTELARLTAINRARRQAIADLLTAGQLRAGFAPTTPLTTASPFSTIAGSIGGELIGRSLEQLF